MSTIAKTEGITLRYAPYSESSRVVTWLTRDAGKLTTMVKGALRPKSPALGQFDLFYTCEVLFYERETHHLHILKECYPLKHRAELRRNWRACAVASYIADLAFRIHPARAYESGMFELIDDALDQLGAGEIRPPFMFWFELQFLARLGLTPRLTHCARCNRPASPGARGQVFDPPHGGLLCPACARDPAPDAIRLTPEVLATLSAWQRARSPALARSTRITAGQEAALEHILGSFLRYHLELPLPSRAVALDVVRRRPGKTLVATARHG